MKGLEHNDFFVPTIPYWWHLIACTLPGKAHAVGSQLWFCYRVAVGSQLWFCYRVSGSKSPVKLSRQWFSLMKFSRYTVRRALLDLEKAGLITAKKVKGRAPLKAAARVLWKIKRRILSVSQKRIWLVARVRPRRNTPMG